MNSKNNQVTVELESTVAGAVADLARNEKKTITAITTQLLTEAIAQRKKQPAPVITETMLNNITHRLVTTYDPLEIYLFGSYAWGLPNEDSDIDLMIIVSHSNNPKIHQRTYDGYMALKDVDIPKELIVLTQEEFLVRADNTDSLAHKVKNHGKCIYRRS